MNEMHTRSYLGCHAVLQCSQVRVRNYTRRRIMRWPLPSEGRWWIVSSLVDLAQLWTHMNHICLFSSGSRRLVEGGRVGSRQYSNQRVGGLNPAPSQSLSASLCKTSHPHGLVWPWVKVQQWSDGGGADWQPHFHQAAAATDAANHHWCEWIMVSMWALGIPQRKSTI